MVRKFLSTAILTLSERLAPTPKVRPWPLSLGVAFTALGAIWIWLLNEEASFARANAEVAKAERVKLKGEVDDFAHAWPVWARRMNVAEDRIRALEIHLFSPQDGERFGALKVRAPTPRAAIGLWGNLPDNAVWCSAERRWSVNADRPAESPRATRPGEDPSLVRHGQIRLGGLNGNSAVHVVAEESTIRALSDPQFFQVRVARGAPMNEKRLFLAHQIIERWPTLVYPTGLSAQELEQCGALDAPIAPCDGACPVDSWTGHKAPFDPCGSRPCGNG